MLKCISQPQLEKFGRADSGCSCDTNDGVTSPSSTAVAEDELCRRPSVCGLRSSAGSTACLKDCVLGSLTKDSGSGVGLDSKIEQAMDLVKGHLMFAVREEVEVLKEQIKNLLARNGQLERENAVLRQYATPETLAKLQAVKKSQTTSIGSGYKA